MGLGCFKFRPQFRWLRGRSRGNLGILEPLFFGRILVKILRLLLLFFCRNLRSFSPRNRRRVNIYIEALRQLIGTTPNSFLRAQIIDTLHSVECLLWNRNRNKWMVCSWNNSCSFGKDCGLWWPRRAWSKTWAVPNEWQKWGQLEAFMLRHAGAPRSFGCQAFQKPQKMEKI